MSSGHEGLVTGVTFWYGGVCRKLLAHFGRTDDGSGAEAGGARRLGGVLRWQGGDFGADLQEVCCGIEQSPAWKLKQFDDENANPSCVRGDRRGQALDRQGCRGNALADHLVAVIPEDDLL